MYQLFIQIILQTNLLKTKKEVKMGTIIVKNAVVRKPGYLYYVDGKGNVCEAQMKRGGGRTKKRKD